MECLPRSGEQMQGLAAHQYCDLRALCVRLSLSRRTVRTFINDPANPLPAYKCGGGKLLCKWTEVERWIRRHRVTNTQSECSLDELATRTLNGLDNDKCTGEECRIRGDA